MRLLWTSLGCRFTMDLLSYWPSFSPPLLCVIGTKHYTGATLNYHRLLADPAMPSHLRDGLPLFVLLPGQEELSQGATQQGPLKHGTGPR